MRGGSNRQPLSHFLSVVRRVLSESVKRYLFEMALASLPLLADDSIGLKLHCEVNLHPMYKSALVLIDNLRFQVLVTFSSRERKEDQIKRRKLILSFKLRATGLPAY